MIRRVLFLLLISVSTYAQDTLAVIERKYRPTYANAFFRGDTVLLELLNETAQTGRIHHTAGWYYHGKKIANVNVGPLRSTLLGFQKNGDTTYYYGYDDQGKRSSIMILSSIGFDSTKVVASYEIEGNVLGSIEDNGKFSAVSFNRKKKTAYVYDLQAGRMSEAGALTLPWNIESVPNKEIVFVSPLLSNMSGEGLKFFLHQGTLSAVFDDRFQPIGETKVSQRTLVIRKDLTTGKVEADGFRMEEHGPFISHINGNFLYRLTPRDELIVQNLDSNKVTYRVKLADITQTEVYRTDNSSTQIKKATNEERLFDRNHSLRVAIGLDNFGDQKVLTLIYLVEEKKGFPLFAPVSIGGVPLLVGGRAVSYYSSYEYLIGTPATGFRPVSENLGFPKMLADNYNLTNTRKGVYDYVSYSVAENCLIGTYGIAKSPVILFIKFQESHD